jgi:single-strand DNA-binding protein
MSLNKVQLIGHLGRDPEIRSTNSGTKVATLNVATSDRWTDKNTGERKEKTEWHRVVIFNEPLVKIVEQYLKKGSKLYLEGALATRKWTDQSGAEKYATEIVLKQYRGEIQLLDRAEQAPAPEPDDYGRASGRSDTGRSPATSSYAADLDDDIPF